MLLNNPGIMQTTSPGQNETKITPIALFVKGRQGLWNSESRHAEVGKGKTMGKVMISVILAEIG